MIIKHVSGGHSTLGFKSYDQGRTKWQGETLDFVWFDEEPPQDVYFEGLTRTNATGGIVYLTFTPLKGMSDLVHSFIRLSSSAARDRPPTISTSIWKLWNLSNLQPGNINTT